MLPQLGVGVKAVIYRVTGDALTVLDIVSIVGLLQVTDRQGSGVTSAVN